MTAAYLPLLDGQISGEGGIMRIRLNTVRRTAAQAKSDVEDVIGSLKQLSASAFREMCIFEKMN
jgi:hypothetical protein